MSLRRLIAQWPLLRQTAEGDPRALGRAVTSKRTRELRPRTAEAQHVVASVCPYCAVGCGQLVYVKDGRVTQIEGDPASPISRGRLCPKGSASKSLVTSPTRELRPRTADADHVVPSICPYCAVGCAQLVYAKGNDVIHVEGDPRSPINQGTLCPKGAATYQLTINPDRWTTVKYRAPFSDHWEDKPLDWAMERIAQRVKQTRDETFVEKLPDGTPVNHTLAIASLGGATLDNEENYVIKKLFGGGLGMVWIENQARV